MGGAKWIVRDCQNRQFCLPNLKNRIFEGALEALWRGEERRLEFCMKRLLSGSKKAALVEEAEEKGANMFNCLNLSCSTIEAR